MKEKKIILDSDSIIENDGLLTENLGIRIHDGTISPFSKVGGKYPSEGSFIFSTHEDNQDQITLEFHRSKKLIATTKSFLGIIRIRDFIPSKAGIPLIRVHFEHSNKKTFIWATNEVGNSELTVTILKKVIHATHKS